MRMVPSATSNVTANANCAVECVSQIPGRHLTIYSVPTRCSRQGQAAERPIAGLIVPLHSADCIAAGPGLIRLAHGQRCPGSEPGAEQ
jgi:hypothetical protein